MLTIGLGLFGESPWRVARAARGCQNCPLSYYSETARPIVTKFGVLRDKAAMHVTQVMGVVHLHVRTCARADVPPFPHIVN